MSGGQDFSERKRLAGDRIGDNVTAVADKRWLVIPSFKDMDIFAATLVAEYEDCSFGFRQAVRPVVKPGGDLSDY